MKELVDEHGRKVRKLRISLTDKCNLRCGYCMPVNSKFMSEKKFLAPDEYLRVVSELCEYGLEEVRLTGGEPLMRSSFKDISARLAALPLKKIGLTTNGILLDQHLGTLKDHRVFHLNVSLDSLEEKNFKRITFGDQLRRVLQNIDTAIDMGFHVKVNVVAMRGINDHEFLDFVEYSKSRHIEVRFLELMKIGYACGKQEEQFMSASDILKQIKLHYNIKSVVMDKDSTSFNYVTECGAQIGFIASESQAFCGQCSRWRLSADGILRACLMKNDGLSIKDKTAEERVEIYHALLGMKPFHRPLEVSHQMNAIGG